MPGTQETASERGAIIINVFSVPEGHEPEEIVAALRAISEQVMRHQPGFRQAAIHVSLNRKRVATYAEWDSAEAFGKVMQDAGVRRHIAEIDRQFPHEADIYQVASIFTTGGEQL